MNYAEFLDAVILGVEEYVGKEAEVRIHKVVKNNGIVLDSIVIDREGHKCSPAIYVNGFYREYENGEKSVEDIVLDIYKLYLNNMDDISLPKNYFTDFNTIKDNISYKLVNYERNKEILSELPHRRWRDLAIVYYVVYVDGAYQRGSITIYNDHLKVWEIDEDELYRLACINTCKLNKPMLLPIMDLLERMKKCENSHDMELFDNVDFYPMYVLTNETQTFGAINMLEPQICDLFAAEYGDFFVVPSSVHEVIFIPKIAEMSMIELIEMVKSVNRNELMPHEVLSDSVYIYEAGKGYV